MMDFLCSVRNLSKDENLVVSYFFYKLCLDVESFSDYDEAQSLYNALVSALSLEDHAEKVIAAVNEKHVNAKALTPCERGKEDHPFGMLGDIKFHYKEDTVIDRKCGRWDTKTPEEIDLVRAVFAGKKEDFTKIIAYTFFYKPNAKLKIFTIPKEIHVPARIITLSKKTDKVRFLMDSLKLTDEEGLILSIAYLFHSIKEFYAFFNEISRCNEESKVSFYGKCIDMSIKTVKAHLRRDKKLVSYGLMDTYGNIDSDAVDCIYAKDLNIFFCDILKKDEKTESYDLDSFSVKKDESELALRLLKNNTTVNILLYGAPGSGKTEYARALVKRAGLVPYIFKNELEVSDRNGNPEKHALGRLNCLLSLEKKGFGNHR